MQYGLVIRKICPDNKILRYYRIHWGLGISTSMVTETPHRDSLNEQNLSVQYGYPEPSLYTYIDALYGYREPSNMRLSWYPYKAEGLDIRTYRYREPSV
jgi:hypothetical protein